MKNLDFKTTTSVWRIFPKLIEWKQLQRDKSARKKSFNLNFALNYSILIDLTVFLEGCFHEILSSSQLIVNNGLRDSVIDKINRSMYGRLIEDLTAKIDNSTWSDIPNLYNVCFGQDLKTTVTNETWKAMSALFTFRNMLTHGKPFSFEFIRENQGNDFFVDITNKYKTVFYYLKEAKIILNDKYDLKVDNVEKGIENLLSNIVIDHFVISSYNFVDEAILNIKDISMRKHILGCIS